MAKFTFEEDYTSRKSTRSLFGLQVAALILVIYLIRSELIIPALVVSILTLIAFVGVVAKLYVRFRRLPYVREKYTIIRFARRFHKRLQVENNIIQQAMQERERLLQAEKEEIENTLRDLREKHVEDGLAAALIKHANLPGIGPDLRQRLMEHGIHSAAQVGEKLWRCPDLGDSQRQELLDWRKRVLEELEASKPVSLPERQLQSIAKKYQALHEKNGKIESRARASKEILEHELYHFAPRYRELAPLRFPTYFSQAITSQGAIAGLLAAALICMQVFTSITTTRSAVMAMMPEWRQAGVSSHLTGLLSTEVPSEGPPGADHTISETGPNRAAACLPQDAHVHTGVVVGIEDSDTIKVNIDGVIRSVRYIGVRPPRQDEPLYEQALAFSRDLLLDHTVTMIQDTSDTDEYNRLLRYVFVGNTFVNQKLVEAGLAKASAHTSDISCMNALQHAQRRAQTARVGLWRTSLLSPVTGGEAATTKTCDASYPDVCIPPAPPDLGCDEITDRRFQVLPPDPHGFDPDGNGIGCEE
jgi:micrococcal nuclease